MRNILNNYKVQCFPISMLAKALGTDPISLLLDWPRVEAPLFVGIGTHEERATAFDILSARSNRYVIDLMTIAELCRHKAFEAATKLLGKPMVPQTVREHLLVVMQSNTHPRRSASLHEKNGHLQMVDTPIGYFEQRESFLREMLTYIDYHCEVVPTAGPMQITDNHRFLSEVLDGDTLDALYLCIERDAVLISDDASLRLLAPEAGVTMSMGVQPVLLVASERGDFSKDDYADAVVAKLAFGHDFVSIRAVDMMMLAKRTPGKVSDKVKAALETFRKPTLDVTTGLEVSCEFLVQAIQRLPSRVAAGYGHQLLKVLQHGRVEHSDFIHDEISGAVIYALNIFGRKLRKNDRKCFEPLLNRPNRVDVSVRPKKLVLAIHELYKRRGHLTKNKRVCGDQREALVLMHAQKISAA